MFGIAKGRNIIAVSLESLQSFVINEEMNGHVITPFLNELTKDPDTFYFTDFYQQTGLGKTSDSEFILENSLYPRNGVLYFSRIVEIHIIHYLNALEKMVISLT